MKKKLSIIKFGGSSLANKNLIKKCAEKVLLYSREEKVIVVVSAMFGVTNDLIQKVESFGIKFDDYSRDLIITSGENVSASIFSAYLNSMGANSLPVCGWQIPIKIKNQEIIEIGKEKIKNILEDNIIPVVTGFQGIDQAGFICSLKRGGSDTTATALASSLEADICRIYTDIGGVYEISPDLVDLNENHHIPEISYKDMYDFSSNGAKVMHSDSIIFAEKSKIPVEVLSSFDDDFPASRLSTIITSTAKKNSCLLVNKISESKFRVYCKIADFNENKKKIVESFLATIEEKSIFPSGFSFCIEHTNIIKNDPIIAKLLFIFENQLKK